MVRASTNVSEDETIIPDASVLVLFQGIPDISPCIMYLFPR